jgi:hypothetical protein
MDDPQSSSQSDVILDKPTPENAQAQDMRTRVEDASRKYLHALQQAWRPEEYQKRVEEAYRDYLHALQEAWRPGEGLKRLEAYGKYLYALQQAWRPEEYQKRVEEAYRDYLRALQGVWTQMDINAVDVGLMTAISQSTMIVAVYTHNALNPGAQLSRTGL